MVYLLYIYHFHVNPAALRTHLNWTDRQNHHYLCHINADTVFQNAPLTRIPAPWFTHSIDWIHLDAIIIAHYKNTLTVHPLLFSHVLIIVLSSEYLFVHRLTLCLSLVFMVCFLYMPVFVFLIIKKNLLPQLSPSLPPICTLSLLKYVPDEQIVTLIANALGKQMLQDACLVSYFGS